MKQLQNKHIDFESITVFKYLRKEIKSRMKKPTKKILLKAWEKIKKLS